MGNGINNCRTQLPYFCSFLDLSKSLFVPLGSGEQETPSPPI